MYCKSEFLINEISELKIARKNLEEKKKEIQKELIKCDTELANIEYKIENLYNELNKITGE